jgi:hypothetical protein
VRLGNDAFNGSTRAHTSKALTVALGLKRKLRPNWSCCHLWSVGDTSYQLPSVVAMDHRFFMRRQYGFASDATQSFYPHSAGGTPTRFKDF